MFKNSKGQPVTAEEATADLNAQLDEAEKALQLEKYKSPLDERAAFEAHESKERRLSPADQRTWFRRGAIADYDCKAIDDAWKAWQARAALQSVMEWTAAENVPDDRKLCLIRNAARAALEQHSPAQELERMKDGDTIIDRLRRGGLSIDGDNTYKRDLLDCVVGALAFGFQGRRPPDQSHWLHRFWEIGNAEREARAVLPTEPLSIQFVNAVKQLCKDFSDRQDRPYMGDVYSALDELLVNEGIRVADEPFPSPQKQSKPCGECRLPEGEHCDICEAKATA